ncbi:spastin [Culex quinquefasciatus]|uniref:Spastin n=1 Tax=Culex quinquefasciatus TaxID=7176 RepID=B0X5A3_CULQU|nr:spastin [Culex quinquefasciatus]|eukprot:XP_001864825.1 spastin [Culex quinquefasciatus]
MRHQRLKVEEECQLATPGNGMVKYLPATALLHLLERGQEYSTPVKTPLGTALSSNQSGQQQQITGKCVEPKLVQIIMDEIVEGGAKVEWQDIAGQ